MPSSLQLEMFNPTTDAAASASAALANGFNYPKTPQTRPPMAARGVLLTLPASLYSGEGNGFLTEDGVVAYHAHTVGPNQCCSVVTQSIDAAVSTVWAVVRRFDNPQGYKTFVKSCHVVAGDGTHVGAVREVRVVSGLPAESSTERLEILDDERHIMSFSVVGGEHRLCNYRSVTTLHHNGVDATLVVESYVVDVPQGNTKEETCGFVDTIVRCNLQSLAQIAENMSKNSM